MIRYVLELRMRLTVACLTNQELDGGHVLSAARSLPLQCLQGDRLAVLVYEKINSAE